MVAFNPAAPTTPFSRVHIEVTHYHCAEVAEAVFDFADGSRQDAALLGLTVVVPKQLTGEMNKDEQQFLLRGQ